MKVPYYCYAYVPHDKIEKYLICLTHPVGKYKAAYFRGIGFDESNIDMFEENLLEIIHSNDYSKRVVNPFGINFEVGGMIESPNGKKVSLITAWTVDNGRRAPRLVSAYPV